VLSVSQRGFPLREPLSLPATLLVDEDERTAVDAKAVLHAPLAPGDERIRHARRQCPRARLIRLILVEHDRAALQVDVEPRQSERLRAPHSLAVKEPIEDAPAKRDPRAREQARVFLGIEPPSGLVGPFVGHESGWQRVVRDEPHREHGHAANAVHELGNVAA